MKTTGGTLKVEILLKYVKYDTFTYDHHLCTTLPSLKTKCTYY